jgi:hypothetical protein
MWSPNPAVLVTDLADELVLMHPLRSEMFSLNASGRLIWQNLPNSTQVLSQLLAQTYTIDIKQAQGDVNIVLKALEERDLVKVS